MKAKIWKAVLLVGIAMVVAYELYAAFSPVSGDTVSELTWDHMHPMFAFVAGLLAGHLFWQARPKKARDEESLRREKRMTPEEELAGADALIKRLALDLKFAREDRSRTSQAAGESARRAVVAEAEVEEWKRKYREADHEEYWKLRAEVMDALHEQALLMESIGAGLIARAEVERLRADNAAMFKNLEEQTARGLQMVGKWQQAEAKLKAVVEELEKPVERSLSAIEAHALRTARALAAAKEKP